MNHDIYSFHHFIHLIFIPYIPVNAFNFLVIITFFKLRYIKKNAFIEISYLIYFLCNMIA